MSFEEHLREPHARGPVPDGAVIGSAGGHVCGDLVRIAVRPVGGRIREISFDAEGCGATLAAASACALLADGAPLPEAARIGPDRVAAELGGLSPGKRHAADLAADALHRALSKAWAQQAVRVDPVPGRVLVAMSGGVDSAAAALLMRRRGHDVVAVTLKLWADQGVDGTRSCCSPEAVIGARALAHSMGFPHVTLDLQDRFRDAVVGDFLAEHARGRTPNPCVRCNGLVRFDAMLELAERVGAEALVTGHYARIEPDRAGPLLTRAADDAKDQTYMLAGLEPGLLERVRFPLGDLTKPEVRALAREAGLAVADKRESQDLCFLAGTNRERFLARHGGQARRPGEVVDRRGEVLGSHDGAVRFTIGQRKGLGVAAGEPLYVLSTDAETNRVVVGARTHLATRRIELAPATLYRDGASVDRVKLRYRSPAVPCRVTAKPGRHDQLAVELEEDFHGAAPGQTACFMEGDRVVGCGTIAAAS
jgi:tRNA-uridine 2-sulfurtransferase